jgi:hypothetical protein
VTCDYGNEPTGSLEVEFRDVLRVTKVHRDFHLWFQFVLRLSFLQRIQFTGKRRNFPSKQDRELNTEIFILI